MHKSSQFPKWWSLQRGQAMVEYWPTIPAAVMVMIVLGALVFPINNVFCTTSDALVGEVPDGPTIIELEDHKIEVTSAVYDPDTDRTTVSFHVSSGDKPAISHWVLGISEAMADRIIQSSEPYEAWGQDPTTGKWGIKFDIGYGEGHASSSSIQLMNYAAPMYKPPVPDEEEDYMHSYVEERDIVLTFSGLTDVITEVEVTTKAGSTQVASGNVTIPAPETEDVCAAYETGSA